MNKYYRTEKIDTAWLLEIDKERTCGGIKNIIGIEVIYNNERLFYSILDDCFFRVIPSKEELIKNWEKYANKIFVEIYDRENLFAKTLGTTLLEETNKHFFTKEELIANQEIFPGYYSDLDYEINLDTTVDYENLLTVEENIINSELEYRDKMNRPITFDNGHIYGPRSLLKTKNNKKGE